MALTDTIETSFYEAMDPATLNQNTFTLVEQGSATPLEATVTYDGATKKATLDPDTDVQANTTYTATVTTGAKDAAGQPAGHPHGMVVHYGCVHLLGIGSRAVSTRSLCGPTMTGASGFSEQIRSAVRQRFRRTHKGLY